MRGPGEVVAADDETPRHDAGADDLAGVVDVVDEAVQRTDALGEPALDVRPLHRRQDARHEVQRKGPLERRTILAGRVEGDPLLDEDRVTATAGHGEQLGPELPQGGGERGRVRTRRPVGLEELVEESVHRLVRRRRTRALQLGHALILHGPGVRRHRRGGQHRWAPFARPASGGRFRDHSMHRGADATFT